MMAVINQTWFSRKHKFFDVPGLRTVLKWETRRFWRRVSQKVEMMSWSWREWREQLKELHLSMFYWHTERFADNWTSTGMCIPFHHDVWWPIVCVCMCIICKLCFFEVFYQSFYMNVVIYGYLWWFLICFFVTNQICIYIYKFNAYKRTAPKMPVNLPKR